jgi:colanic acid/amylovoran biosynthesis glycosyltransferase
MSRKESSLRLGYLISQYPAVNHTFILHEVRALRQLGFDVRVVSIRKSDRPVGQLSADEAEEGSQTFSVLGAGWRYALVANARVLLRTPVSYIRSLLYAWSLTSGTPKLLLPYTFYFLEAVVAGDYFRRNGVSFVHSHFSSTVTLLLSRLFATKYSLTIHGSAEFEDVVGFHMAEKVAGAVFVATISQYGSSQVMKASDPAHWHKVLVLPLGVDSAAFAPRVQSVRAAGEPFKMVFVGSLAPPKALQVLIAAVELLGPRAP